MDVQTVLKRCSDLPKVTKPVRACRLPTWKPRGSFHIGGYFNSAPERGGPASRCIPIWPAGGSARLPSAAWGYEGGVVTPGPGGLPPALPDLASARDTPYPLPGPCSHLRALPRSTLHAGGPTAPRDSPLGLGWSSGILFPARLPSEGAKRWDAQRHQGPSPQARPPRPSSFGTAAVAGLQAARGPGAPLPGWHSTPSAYPLWPRRCGPLARPPDPASSHRVWSHRRRPPRPQPSSGRRPPAGCPGALPWPAPSRSRTPSAPSRARLSSSLPSPSASLARLPLHSAPRQLE